MSYTDYSDDENLQHILDELSSASSPMAQNNSITAHTVTPAVDANNLEQYIIENGAQTVSTTQAIIATLIDQINVTPDAELITSVAEMVSSNNKALETLAKLHLNKEKHKHAMELENYKAQAKSQLMDKTRDRKPLTREEIMALVYEDTENLKISE